MANNNSTTKWLYAIVLAFLLANSILFMQNRFELLLFPLILLIITLFLFSFDKVLFIAVFSIPFSINYAHLFGGLGLSIPAEPLLIGLAMMFLLKIIYQNTYDKTVLKHPITFIIICHLAWLLITTLTSKDIIVSLKYTFSRTWFIISFYFIAVLVFKQFKNIKRYVWLYLIPFLGVIIYTLVRHSEYNFAQKPGHWVMTPFYNDHTAYGAALSFFLPILGYLTITKTHSRFIRLISLCILIIVITALILSFSRASWVGVAGALVILFMMILKINYKWLLGGMVITAIAILIFWSNIENSLYKNKQDSSSNLIEHAQSISNVTTDASNLERINRWHSALRMFKEKPIFGFGPGTYQFFYGPYQLSKDRTIISTNAGDLGNAHSEYIGPLAETGLIGSVIIILLVVYTYITGLKIFIRSKNKEIKMLTAAILLSLTTYFIHGTLNNFLDSDKLSALFWGFIAMIVALDLYHDNTEPIINTNK